MSGMAKSALGYDEYINTFIRKKRAHKKYKNHPTLRIIVTFLNSEFVTNINRSK